MTENKRTYSPESVIYISMMMGVVVGMVCHLSLEIVVDWLGGPWDTISFELERWLCIGINIGTMLGAFYLVYILTKKICKYWPLKAEDPQN